MDVLRRRFRMVDELLLAHPHHPSLDLWHRSLSEEDRFCLFILGTPKDELALLAASRPPSRDDLVRRSLSSPARGDNTIGNYTEVLIPPRGSRYWVYDGIGTKMVVHKGTLGSAARVEQHVQEARWQCTHFYNALRKYGGTVLFYSNYRADIKGAAGVSVKTSALLLGVRIHSSTGWR